MANFQHYIFHNFGLKLFSLALAVSLWLVVARNPNAEVAIEVPIEFHHIPENLEINSEHIPMAQVRLRGPEHLIHRLHNYDVHVEVELSDAKPGERTFDLTSQQVRQPRELSVVQVVPSQFHLSFDTRATRQVDVRPRVTGNFASGLRIAKIVSNPGVISIVGPRTRVEAVEAAITDPIDASGVVTTQTFSTNVYVADPLVQVVRPAPVHVTITMEKSPSMSEVR
jgi:YbbR domain-containing protein